MSLPDVQFNVFVDSDGPIADFDKALISDGREADIFKMHPGLYIWLDVTVGAKYALEGLKELDDANDIRVWILTKTPSQSPYAYTEKVLWYRQHFPWLEDRVILTHDKSLLGTENDVLIDDRPHKAKANKFRGQLCVFNPKTPSGSWADALQLILSKLKITNA